LIDANQMGNTSYDAAIQTQQSFTVGPKLMLIVGPFMPVPGSFTLHGNPTINPKTGAITFTVAVGDPGTVSWLLTFPNGRFGAFSANKSKCKTGQTMLAGRCRPEKIVFGKASKVFAAAGIVSFTITPSVSARKALEHALRKGRGVPVMATLTFGSSLGGSPVSHKRSITDALKRKSRR
jgi:hypothetical protein